MERVQEVIREIFECSVYVAPREPGLTREEVLAVAQRLGLRHGEALDALRTVVRSSHLDQARLWPDDPPVYPDFMRALIPDFRKPEAFDFVFSYFLELARDVGLTNAQVPQSVIIAAGIASGLQEHDLDVALSTYALAEWTIEKDNHLELDPFRRDYAAPCLQVSQQKQSHTLRREGLHKAYEAVKDIVARRTDGRLSFPEPLDAFERVLDELGHGRFLTWWAHTVSELRLANPAISPLTACVF
jgi:hypothetical protein